MALAFRLSHCLIFIGSLTAALFTASLTIAQETPPPSQAVPKSVPTSPAADLPSASQIVHEAIEAMGGRKAIDAIKSTSIKATISSARYPGDIQLEVKLDNRNRMLMSQLLPDGTTVAIGSDGTIGWKSNPLEGGYQLLSPEQTLQAVKQYNLFGILFNLEQDFKNLETIDKTTFNGEECYKLEMVADNLESQKQAGFFSVSSKLMTGMENTEQSPMGPVVTTFTFKEWNTVSDVKVFKTLEIANLIMTVTMKVTDLEFNKVDPAVFELPEEVKKLVEAQNEAGAGSAPGSTPSTRPASEPRQPTPQ